MKQLLALAFGVMPFLVFSQAADTTAVVKQVDSLLNLAIQITNAGKPQEALLLLDRAGNMLKKNLGKEHPKLARCLAIQGGCNRMLGEYQTAESLLLESKAIREKVFGEDHPEFAISLNLLGLLYHDMSRFEEAEAVFLQAKTIWGKTFGRKHRSYLAVIINLGQLYNDIGRYENAEPLFLEAKKIFEVDLKDRLHPFYLTCLNNLGVLYLNLGRFETAEQLYVECKALMEESLGKKHPDYARSLNNLAILYYQTGRYQEAESLYLECQSIQQKTIGKENVEYAATLINLGITQLAFNRQENAVANLLESKHLFETEINNKRHPFYTNCLASLGDIYLRMNRIGDASLLYLETKNIREDVLGRENKDYAESLRNLASLNWQSTHYEAALPFFSEANVINRKLLTQAVRHLSERELFSYVNLFVKSLGEYFSFIQTNKSLRNSDLLAACYDNALFHKGFLLTAAIRVKHLAAADSAASPQFELLAACHRRLAKEYAKPIVERKNVPELETKANDLEKELTRTVAGFGEAIRQVNWQEVQANLKPGEAAIELVHYQFSNPTPTDSTMYAALVLRPGDKSPRWVTLFEERQLSALLEHPQAGKDAFVNQLYSSPALYNLIWKPLEKSLDGVERIYYAPSGLLHRLSPEAFQCGENQVLAERHDLHRLGSTRQLVTDGPASTFAGGDAVVYGGVRYEMDSSAIANANKAWIHEENAEPGGLAKFRGEDGNTWGYLKWTEIEAKSVAELLTAAGVRVEVRQGYTATEESFAALSQKSAGLKVLHLATHAFFFPDPKGNPQSAIRNPQSNEPVFKMSEHPMMRSGLVLAGANHAWIGGKPLKGMEDGILTAYEISQMNLNGVELVVLSACETGLGDIEGNEGVYGLQRAFKIAGAKYLVMSLWQVPDYQTEELMTVFYAEWLEGKKSIPEAFRSARLQMRAQHPEPFKWAGFVLVE